MNVSWISCSFETVTFLIDESSHLVDLGCGYPFFEAIPLHRLPRSYSQAGLEYQLAIVDGQLARLHKRGDSVPEGEVIHSNSQQSTKR